ncbi:glycoside hydrolase family 26 protein [Kitasatospora sp. NPDC004615]|uniref:glycoside hydrolase family 26 protein n=1 Tax=unclassified Kitasatospora TaxID=2633591 RepID=UPI0036A04248
MSKRRNTNRRKTLHWWSRGSGIRLRVWMVVNGLLLCTLSYGVLAALGAQDGTLGYHGLGNSAKTSGLDRLLQPKKAEPVIPGREIFANPEGKKYFGVSTQESPFSSAEVTSVQQSAGAAPSMTEYFVQWNQEFDPKAITAAYGHGTLPVLAWEPWAGTELGKDQPDYALSTITGGKHDDYINRFAQAVATQKWPVAIRFAHEMNGSWYPWSEQANGNHAGDYVQAWRHVHDLFKAAGATNVIWVWSPNILRPVPDIDITKLYPGDQYVDWAGMVGYGTNEERTADATFGPTLDLLRSISSKPILITETGREPNSMLKPVWISDFFAWLAKQPDVVGFIWFQRNKSQGAEANWRFDDTTPSLRAFSNGLRQITLADGHN